MAPGMWLRRTGSRTRKRRKMADDQEASTSSAAPSKKRSSPSKSESPQRSPNVKRKRTQADRYQSDVVEAFSKHSKTRTPTVAKKEMYFGKGAYLAIRSEGGFYLAQTLKYVYDNSRTLQIQWLEETKKGIYKMSFLDFADRDSVLTQVQLKPAGEKGLKKLPDKEISRIEKILNLSVKKEKGQLSDADGRASLDQLSEQLAKTKGKKSTTPTKQTPAAKKTPTRARIVASKIGRNARQQTRRKTAATGAKKKAVSKKEKKGGRKGKPKEEKVKRGRGKQDPNSKLVPNTKIELVNKDPMFEVKSENSMPEVSKVVQCKRAIRAVLTNDMPLLKQLLANTKKVPSMFVQRSVMVTETAMGYALKANSQSFIKALLAELNSKATRCSMPAHSLTKESTGSYNYISRGHAVRDINISRGGREGNNAFIKDSYARHDEDQEIAQKIMDYGCNMNTVDLILRERPDIREDLSGNIVRAVKNGHRILAGQLVKRANADGGFGMNKLHEEVLLCDKPEELSPFKSVSVKKKPYMNDRFMPLHCAAINPNPKILDKLLSVVPEVNVADTKGRKIIHYAAACTGSGPLECLLQRMVFADDTDNQGNTPLMIAASLNRTQNIEVLVKKLKSEEKGGVFRKNTFGFTPLHYAAKNGHADAVRALIKHGADLQAPLSAGKNKLTPFMVACEQGHQQVVKLLAESGAILDQKDKLKRTPLMLAVINGHVPIAAFLLRKGCDPNAKDSSGNTSLHYAAGYGWWFVLRLLLSAGADPSALNDWKVPPLAIAFMKGHVGCAELLLDDSSVDVNFRDGDGWTIVMLTVCVHTPEMMDQLKYLIEEKHASAGLKDANDWNALHHLAATNGPPGQQEKKDAAMKISVDMATLLLARGCDPHAKTSDGESVLDIAIKKPHYNALLVKFLLEKGSQLTNFTNKQDENLLHLMSKRCLDSDQTELFNIIVENMKKEAKSASLPNDTGAATPAKNSFSLKEQAKASDKAGYTPLLRWTQVYVTSLRRNDESLEKGRAFLKCLLNEAEPDVNGIPTLTDAQKDTNEKRTVVHMLCSVTEKPGKVVGTESKSDYPALEEIMKYKPNLNLREKEGRTPLHMAINAKKVELAQYLVKSGADITLKSQEEKDDKFASPLILALKFNLFSLVDNLLTSSTVHSAEESLQLTPIHYAAMSTHRTPQLSVSHIIQKLLDKGANINCKDGKGRTPLHYACKAYVEDKDPSTDTVELMIDNKADVFAEDLSRRLPLHYLFFNMDDPGVTSHIDPIEAVSLLKEAMKKKKIDHPDIMGQTPIHAAALRGAIISLMDIAECVPSVDTKDLSGNTPLVCATVGGHLSVVIFLLQREANISVDVTKLNKDEDEKKKEKEEPEKEHLWTWKALRKSEDKASKNDKVESLFRTVVRNGWQGILFLLMDRLERFNVPYITPIKAAIEEHRLQMALNLISKSREHRIDSVTDKQQNLLHILALCSAGQHCDKVAEKLLSKGVGLRTDQFRCTPLTYSVLAENTGLCKILWARMKQQDGKQMLTSTDVKGRNLLAAAFWRRPNFNETLVSWLLEIGASLNVTFPVPLWDLEGQGAAQVSSAGLEEWYHQTDHPVGNLSPLIAAIRVGNFHQVQYLLRKGADPNYPGKDSLTPLMHAVKKNDILLVKVLLNHDYDPSKEGVKLPTKKAPQMMSLGRFGVGAWNPQGLTNGGDDEDSDEDNYDDDEDNSEQDMDDGNDEEEDEPEEDEDEPEEDEDEPEKDEDMDENGNEDEDEDNGDKMDDEEGDADKKPKEGKGAKKIEETPFEKTSSIDLSAADSRGRTVIHHMMRTCDYGTYENVDLLKLFHKLAVPMDTKDGEGQTALDYALQVGSHTMASELQKLQGKKMTLPTSQKSTWTDGCDWTGDPSIHFREDAQKLLDTVKQESEKNSEELPKYPKPKVDHDAQLKEAGEVLIDTEQDIPYDILMTKVDVKYGVYGMNNFYKMQVVFAKGKDMYVLLTRWGRVGDTGQFQRTPFPSKQDAITEFCKIFRAKSGNQWSNVKAFSRMKGKYNLVRTDPYFDRRSVKKVEFNFKTDKSSKLPSGTQELLKTLTSDDMLKQAMKACGASERLLPFGHIQRDVLDQASKVLQEIQVLHTEGEKPGLTNDKKLEIYDKIADLSSEFYMLVPNENFSYQRMGMIQTKQAVEEALKHLGDMADLELTGKVMLGAQQRVADVNPLDYIYRSLDCDIEPLEEDDVMSQLILKQIHNTKQRHDVGVQRIYRVRRKGEEDRLAGCSLGNHKLLWHGTKPFNILSILKRGLLVTPIGAPITGFRFGTALYHADMFAKSYDYCRNYNSSCKSNFLFVNEVVLGSMQPGNIHSDETGLKKGHSSIKYGGSEEPLPAQDLLLPSGAVLPVGPVQRRKGFTGYGGMLSEFVVYKETQVCLRYLVQLKS